MALFMAVMTEEPTPKEEGEGKLEKILYYPAKPIVAKDSFAAGLQMFKEYSDLDKVDPNKLKIHIRPF